jgi:transcriptional regulator with XRE-family HTH domain
MREIRQSRGLTQEQVAERMGMIQRFGSVSTWETGRQRPTVRNLERYLDACGSNLLELSLLMAGPIEGARIARHIASGKPWRDADEYAEWVHREFGAG